MADDKPKLVFERFDTERARTVRDDVESIYVESYVNAIASGDPFDSVETFMHRFDVYTRSAAFDMVVAFVGDEAVGQTWGWSLGPTSQWWSGLLSTLEADFTREDGRRTFALSEIMVRERWTGHGIAHSLHDELLVARKEERATLLVEPDNTRARQAYLHWGWRPVAQLRPGWENAPFFDVMILPLPIVTTA